MKKGTRVALALVLALTMVIGSASIVSAKGPPAPTCTAEITDVRSTEPGWITYDYTITWSHCKVTRIETTLFDDTKKQFVHIDSIDNLKGRKVKLITRTNQPGVSFNVDDDFVLTVNFYNQGNPITTVTDTWPSP